MIAVHADLVVHHPSERSFEDAVRDTLRNSPYLAFALFVHAAVMAVLWFVEVPLPEVEDALTLAITPEPPVEPLPPETKPLEPPTPEQPVDTVIDPFVTELVPLEDTTIEDTLEPDAGDEIFSAGRDPIIGTDSSNPGSGNGPHGRGKPGGHAPPALTAAADAGLTWLAAHQNSEGHWSATAFDLECGKLGEDTVCDGVGSAQVDVGVTGLALLAFLGAGHTHHRGEHRRTVRDALEFLVDNQRANGCFANDELAQHSYDHIVATLAMVEAYSMTRWRVFERSARSGLAYMEALRTPGEGWRYAHFHPDMLDPAKRSDTSATGWAILALTSALDAGLDVADGSLDDAMSVIERMTDRETGRTGYLERGGPPAREEGAEALFPSENSEALTGVALLCRIFADPELEVPGNRAMIEKGMKLLERFTPRWEDGHVDLYGWYYATYALYQVRDWDQALWRRWERAIVDAIAAHQHKRGELRGSWDPQQDPWGHVGGRVYSTALMTLTMEVFYRYGTIIGR